MNDSARYANFGLRSSTRRPLIIALGGTTRMNSSSERAGRVALAAAGRAGAETRFFPAAALEFPMYAPERSARTPEAADFIDSVRRADGLIVASPGYHGGMSGLIKNALDYIEDLRDDERPYLDGRAVACIAVATGWQATSSTLAMLRSVVHALRGWPTPLGVTLNSSDLLFDDTGAPFEAGANLLDTAGCQVTQFALNQAATQFQAVRVTPAMETAV